MKRIRGRVSTGAAVATATALLAALALAGVATAEKPVTVRAGNLELTANGGFRPKALSKTKWTPITFNVSGDIKTIDGTHPPAMDEFILETDKNGKIDVSGVPVCKVGKIEATDTKHAEAACRPAIIGEGHATAGIEFAESPEIDAKSKVIAFNGGVKGGVTTLYIHAYITVPTPAAIVSTVKITKIHKGRYGTLAVTTIPKIAGGAGSVKHFDLTITRKGVLLAKCTDGKLQARGSAHFTDGTTLSAAVVRTCTPKP
jgi:hypothetical protein